MLRLARPARRGSLIARIPIGTPSSCQRPLEAWFERNERRRTTARRFFCQQEAVESVFFL
jgi:hypothetical protein